MNQTFHYLTSFNQTCLVILPVFEDMVDVSLVVDGDEEAMGPPEDEAEPLAGEAHRGGVDHRHVLFDVFA